MTSLNTYTHPQIPEALSNDEIQHQGLLKLIKAEKKVQKAKEEEEEERKILRQHRINNFIEDHPYIAGIPVLAYTGIQYLGYTLCKIARII